MTYSSAKIDTAALKAQHDVYDVALRLGAELRKVAHSEYAGPCPKCDGDDRFHVNIETQRWMCSHCCKDRDDWRDVIALVQLVKGCDFMTACRELGAPVSISTPVQRTSTPKRAEPPCWKDDVWQAEAQRLVQTAEDALPNSHGAAYLESRGLTLDTARAWRVGYGKDTTEFPKWSISLPWVAPDGRVLGINYRRIFTTEKKYRFRLHGERKHMPLFGLHLLDKAHTLVLAEVRSTP